MAKNIQETLASPKAAEKKLRRQFVSFQFLKLDPAWRGLAIEERQNGIRDFSGALSRFKDKSLFLSYSLLGLRGDCDFMLWRIAYDLETFQEMTARLLATPLGRFLSFPYSYLAMTKRSIYVKEHEHPGSESSRLQIVPGGARYLFVYPFVKTRTWYSLPTDQRQRMMDEHIAIGHKYPSVKINTAYSFGLDDQEFVLAFESDKPEDFLDLVMALRESEASRYTLRDTPTFTCVAKPIGKILEEVSGAYL